MENRNSFYTYASCGTRPTLTPWARETHICVDNITIIGSVNGSSPDRRQAIILTNDGILLIGPLGTNFSEILIKVQTFSFKIMRSKVSSAKWRPFCLGLNVLTIALRAFSMCSSPPKANSGIFTLKVIIWQQQNRTYQNCVHIYGIYSIFLW